MKTETTKVTETLQIWAIPQSDYWRENHPDELPFRYAIKTHSPYEDGAVKVCEQEVTLWVPEGVDLLEKAIETLQGEIKEEKIRHKDRVDQLQKQINSLLLLEHQVDPEVV